MSKTAGPSKNHRVVRYMDLPTHVVGDDIETAVEEFNWGEFTLPPRSEHTARNPRPSASANTSPLGKDPNNEGIPGKTLVTRSKTRLIETLCDETDPKEVLEHYKKQGKIVCLAQDIVSKRTVVLHKSYNDMLWERIEPTMRGMTHRTGGRAPKYRLMHLDISGQVVSTDLRRIDATKILDGYFITDFQDFDKHEKKNDKAGRE